MIRRPHEDPACKCKACQEYDSPQPYDSQSWAWDFRRRASEQEVQRFCEAIAQRGPG